MTVFVELLGHRMKTEDDFIERSDPTMRDFRAMVDLPALLAEQSW